MSMAPVQSAYSSKRRNAMTLSKALNILGHEQWSSLDEDDEDVNLILKFKDKLDRIMYEKYLVIENRRSHYVKREAEVEEMDDSALKKRLQYDMDYKLGKDANQDERELHEAYQFCLREYIVRHRPRPNDPTTPKRKKDKKRSSEVVSQYRGAKSFYEKVAESLPGEIIEESIIEPPPSVI